MWEPKSNDPYTHHRKRGLLICRFFFKFLSWIVNIILLTDILKHPSQFLSMIYLNEIKDLGVAHSYNPSILAGRRMSGSSLARADLVTLSQNKFYFTFFFMEAPLGFKTNFTRLGVISQCAVPVLNP